MKSKFWKKTLAAALALIIVSGAVPVQPVSQLFERTAVTAFAAGLTYIDEYGVSQPIPAGYQIINSSNESVTWEEGWYYVPAGEVVKIETSDPTLPAVTARGDVKLVLEDGATLSIHGRCAHTYHGETGHSLTVYGQAQGTGQLWIQGTPNTTEDFSNENGSLTVNGGSVATSYCINAKNITLNGGALSTTNHIHLPNDGTLTLAGGKVSPTNGYDFESGAKMTIKDGMVYVYRKAYSYEFKEFQGTLTAEEIAEIKGKDFVSASKVILPETIVNGSIVTDKTLVLGSAEGDDRKVTLNLTPDDGYHVARVTVNGEEITSETNEYTFTMPKTNAEVNAVFACSCTYLNEDGVAAVTDAIPLTGNETELAAGTYVVNQDISYTNELTLKGNVKLILADGYTCTMSGDAQIHAANHNLTIYGQTEGTGKLHSEISGICIDNVKDYAQYGGIVELTSKDLRAFYGADGGTFKLAGGTMNATAVETSSGTIIRIDKSADITDGTLNISGTGYGNNNGYGIWCGTKINISGGKININMEKYSYGYGIYCNNGDINISGGTVDVNVKETTFGYGLFSWGGITINGGTVNTEAAGTYGFGIDTQEILTITGGQITAIGSTCCIESWSLSISFSESTDYLYANCFSDDDNHKVKIAEGQKATDGTHEYTGTLDTDEKATLAGQTLKPVTHTVIWQNEDGTTLETDEKVVYGAAPSYDHETPAKAADSSYTYTFSGWRDGTNTYAPDALPKVAGDVTYTAQFTRRAKYVAPSYYSQTWTMTMKDYEYDGTAHIPTINGTAHTYSYTEVKYTYYNTDTGEELDGAPSAVGNYRVEVYADGGPSYWSRTQYATYSITNPIDANGMAKVDAFKENDTVPVSDGKIFAGWFTDETCTTAYTENTGKAYAKFIDESILTVKAQISSGTTVNSASTAIRFITSLDSLKYQNIGFKITFNGKTIEQKLTKVYSSLLANGKKVNPAVFSEESHYMGAFTLNGIPSSAFGKEFTVTPYYTTQDGTIVEGATNTFTIASMISK